MNTIYLRPVELTDCDLVYNWANDPITRRNSYNSNTIDYNEHVTWFNKNLSKNWFIFHNHEDIPIGIVRFDFKNDEWIIGICVDPHHRGNGYAAQMIRQAVLTFTINPSITKVAAYIKEENSPSKKAFGKAGFVDDAFLLVSNHPSYKMVYTRSEN